MSLSGLGIALKVWAGQLHYFGFEGYLSWTIRLVSHLLGLFIFLLVGQAGLLDIFGGSDEE